MDYETKTNLITAALALVLVAVIVLIAWKVITHQNAVEQRAAYLEGRFDLDHATAMVYARMDVEMMKEVR